MYAPLSEYIEIRLEEAFCKEHRVVSSCDRPTYEWEDYKEAFANWLVNEFTKDNMAHPRHPKNKHWDE